MAGEIRAIVMPKWGMEMTEGEIAEWHVAEGDKVPSGADLVDVETSKIVNTITAPAAGVVRKILARPGETYRVGALLGVLSDAEASDAEIERFTDSYSTEGVTAEEGSETPTKAAPAPNAEKTEKSAESSDSPTLGETEHAHRSAGEVDRGRLDMLAEGSDDSRVAATPVARRLARQLGVNLHNIEATGRHGRVSKADLEKAVTEAGGQLPASAARGEANYSAPRPDNRSIRATPVARRLAEQLGVSLSECRVSGDRGRICKADVEAAAALKQRTIVPPDHTEGPPAYEEAPLTGMRRTIARRLQESKQTAPHYRVQVDARVDALLTARQQINDANTDAKVSLNDFIVKACATALMQVPSLNVQFDEGIMRQYRDADISVAVAIDDGLVTPIVKAANIKGLIAISGELKDLVARARLGNLATEEFQGGTFSVSNLGMFGIKQFDAIINSPQAAILAVGASELRPVIRDGELETATMVSLTLSSDHRIIDGATAAHFLGVLKNYLEHPATILG